MSEMNKTILSFIGLAYLISLPFAILFMIHSVKDGFLKNSGMGTFTQFMSIWLITPVFLILKLIKKI